MLLAIYLITKGGQEGSQPKLMAGSEFSDEHNYSYRQTTICFLEWWARSTSLSTLCLHHFVPTSKSSWKVWVKGESILVQKSRNLCIVFLKYDFLRVFKTFHISYSYALCIISTFPHLACNILESKYHVSFIFIFPISSTVLDHKIWCLIK